MPLKPKPPEEAALGERGVLTLWVWTWAFVLSDAPLSSRSAEHGVAEGLSVLAR